MRETDHVETVATIHNRSEQKLDRHQRFIERLTSTVGKPRTIYLLLAAVCAWVAWNMVASAPYDKPPFFWLQGVIALYAAVVSTMVLTTQRRIQKHVDQRAYFDLQVNLSAEHKTAKIIQLLEELRRDLPSVQNRVDPEANAMARGVDADASIQAIEERLESPND